MGDLRDGEDARSRELFERLQKIAGQVPGVVYQYKLRPDGSSCFPYASERIREIYRVAPEDVREDAARVFAVLHPDDHEAILASIMASAATLRPWELEYRVRFPDGAVRWLHGRSVPQREADGAVLWHGFITDITDRKAADAAKAQLEAQLRQAQKEESLGRLAGGVAHDFNNLLTAVLGYAELARLSVEAGSVVHDHVSRIIESARRGAELTQQLLAFARRKIVTPEVVDLRDVLRRMAPMLGRLVGEHLELVVTPGPDPCGVRVDVGSLEQVIINLALNARDAMPGGGRLTLEAHAPGGRAGPLQPARHVRLIVRDTGAGMTPEVQARIFEPFFTTKPVGQGTGLGLAVVEGIVTQAGGRIAVHSAPGQGSTFEVLLPEVTGALAAAPAPATSERAEVRGGAETVLLVEDDPTILAVARASLGALGYRMVTAPDGAAALEAVARLEGPLDLLVTDVVMPRLGGRALAARLQAARPGLRVLFMSGYAEAEIAHHGVVDADLHLLQKPFTPALLARRVREVLDAVAGRAARGARA